MKLLFPPLALVLLAAPSRDEIALRFAPEEGTTLERTFEAHAEYHLADVSASIDDEPLEAPDELPDLRTEFDEHIVATDVLRSVEDGRVTELARTFGKLSQHNVDSFEDERQEADLESDLSGRTLLFTWDADEESYSVESGDEQDLDENLAAWLAEDMDLRLVLPKGEVESGDEWELDPKLYLAFMWPGGLLDFRAEDEELTEEDRDPSRQTIENLEGSGTAKLEEIRDEDGVRVAVIHVELEIKTSSESVLPAIEGDEGDEGDDEENPGRPEITIEVEIERTVTGTILWDLEHNHALSADLECSSTRLQSQSWTLQGEIDGEEVEAQYEQARRLEGTITYHATIERK